MQNNPINFETITPEELEHVCETESASKLSERAELLGRTICKMPFKAGETLEEKRARTDKLRQIQTRLNQVAKQKERKQTEEKQRAEQEQIKKAINESLPNMRFAYGANVRNLQGLGVVGYPLHFLKWHTPTSNVISFTNEYQDAILFDLTRIEPNTVKEILNHPFEPRTFQLSPEGYFDKKSKNIVYGFSKDAMNEEFRYGTYIALMRV